MATSVLIIVQNLPVPLDRRVWLECQALRDAGYEVSVICPKGPGDPSFEVLDGVSLYKYRGAPATEGFLSYVFEFAYSWLRTALLSLKVYRRHRFSILQACNPPDTYWLLAKFFQPLGVKFVFDQHDLNPELFLSRFGEPAGAAGKLQLRVLKWLERRTYRTADHVISTNGSYRGIAMRRGGKLAADVTIVRSGPDTHRMRPAEPRPELRKGADHLLAYLGIMGPQDNVEVLLRVMDKLVHDRGRRDVHLALLGFGDCLEALQAEALDRGLGEWTTFTGRADSAMITDYLSTATLGLSPDLKTPLNDISTHNKTMEYMAFGLPGVTFDLVETRVSAEDTAVYVGAKDGVDDEDAFVDAIVALLDDPARREQMGRAARVRCVTELDWAPQARAYVGVFHLLSGRSMPEPVSVQPPAAPETAFLPSQPEPEHDTARASDASHPIRPSDVADVFRPSHAPETVASDSVSEPTEPVEP